MRFGEGRAAQTASLGNITVDVSDLQRKAALLASFLTEKEGKAMIYAAFKRTGSRTRAIVKKDVPKQYEIGANFAASAVGNARTTQTNMGVECHIPITGKRGSIGGRFKAAYGAHGWESLRRKYRVRARIVKSGRSTLPATMDDMHGKPPFRNLSAPSLHGAAFTREGRERLPIHVVVGVAVPQMPLNRSREDVQEDLRTVLNDRIEHEFVWRMKKCR